MKKILNALLIIFMLFIFTGCKENKSTLVVGLEAAYEPFNWAQPKKTKTNFLLENGVGYVEGYDVFIAKEIALKLNKILKIKKIDWDGLIPALNQDQIDIVIAGMTRNPEREKEIDFTSPYYESEIVMVLRTDSIYRSKTKLSEFKNAKIASQRGTIYSDISKRNFKDKAENVSITEFDNYSDMLLNVQKKTCDLFIAEYPVASNIIKNVNDIEIISLTQITDFEKLEKIPVNIGIKKNRDDNLLNEINLALNEISYTRRQRAMDDAINLFHEINKNESNLFKKYALLFLKGVGVTLLLSIVGTLGGLVIGFGLLSMRNQKIDKKRDNLFVKIGKYTLLGFSRTYITIIRGTPMMVQAIIVFFGLAPIFRNSGFWTPLVASLFIVTFNTAAYIAEILRSGINALDKGQEEAARSLGLNKTKTNLLVIWPQVVKNSLPSIGNEFIVNLKDTSVLSVIGLLELFNAGRTAAHETYKVVTISLIVALIYLILTFGTSRLIAFLENKQKKEKAYGKLSYESKKCFR